MKDVEKKKNTALIMTVVLMLVLVVLGRAVSYFYTLASTDISYAAWVSPVLSYLAEILACARTVFAMAGIVHAVYFCEKRSAVKFVCAAACIALVDYVARFLIDLASSAIVGAELLAISWLLMQFLYEMIFVVLSYVIATAVLRKYRVAATARQAGKYTANRACMYSLLLVMLSRIALEVWYLIDFLLAYTDVTSTEMASIVGSFLKVIVIYGGLSVIMGEWYTEFLKKRR